MSPSQRKDVETACDDLLSCRSELSASPGYQYDVVSVVRDLLTDRGLELAKQMHAAFAASDRAAFHARFAELQELLRDMDRLVGTQGDFLLGRWIASARAGAGSPDEADLCEENARNILTLWGDRDRNIRDYSRRQWAGLISGFYLPRWERFADYLDGLMQKNAPFDRNEAKKLLVEFESAWCREKDLFATEPKGDPAVVAASIRQKYRNPPAQSPGGNRR